MPDDTDMTADEFMATRKTGKPVRVVKSRAEYDEALSLHPMDPEDALRMLLGKTLTDSPWRVAVDDADSVTIGTQRFEGWAVRVEG